MILNLKRPMSFLFLTLGSLSNKDGDGHVNGKKPIGLGHVHKYPYSFENATFFLRSQKKFASPRSFLASFSPVYTNRINRFENDNLTDCARLTHTCSLLWAREIINWRLLWISLVWVGIPKQWNGGHVGVPNQSSGRWTLFLCKHFRLFQ